MKWKLKGNNESRFGRFWPQVPVQGYRAHQKYFRIEHQPNHAVRGRVERWRIGSMYLFSTRNGKPYKISGFDSIWQRAVKRSKLENFTFHDLRAKALTDAQRKHGRDYAQALADHESGNTTERYIRGRERRTVLPLK